MIQPYLEYARDTLSDEYFRDAKKGLDINKVLAVGEEARKMIGRTPGNIIAVRPLRDGVISANLSLL